MMSNTLIRTVFELEAKVHKLSRQLEEVDINLQVLAKELLKKQEEDK